MMKRTKLINKLSCFLAISLLLISMPIGLATTTSVSNTTENNEILTITESDTYAGYMSVHPGDPYPWDLYSPDLNIEINKDFGGVDHIIHVKNGESITFTADYKIRHDTPVFDEKWEFKLSLKREWDGKTFEYEEKRFSDDIGGDSKSGTITLEWTPNPKKSDQKFLNHGEGIIYCSLFIKYSRVGLGYDHWDERTKSKDTKEVKIILDNDPPKTPDKPKGPNTLEPGQKGMFGTSTTDPNGDDIEYGWDWNGDMIVDEWTESDISGNFVPISHTWENKGTYKVRVKARDTYCVKAKAESDWSEPREISVTKARSKDNTITNPYLKTLLEKWNFPLLKNILNLN